jgi:hypothetical protein
MRRALVAGACLFASGLVLAHVTPNVQLVNRGEFTKSSLASAVTFSERRLQIDAPDLAAIRKATHWTPSEEDVKMYAGRDAQGNLVGTAAFVWMPSEHGPVGIGVAFDRSGRILKAEVTDVGTEPLVWVRPLLHSGGMTAFQGLLPDQAADPGRIAPDVTGRMNRYYAEVIARGVFRAQALERISLGAVGK